MLQFIHPPGVFFYPGSPPSSNNILQAPFTLQAAQAVAASGLLTSKDPLPEAVGNMVIQFARSRGASSYRRQPQVMALMDDIQVSVFLTFIALSEMVEQTKQVKRPETAIGVANIAFNL